MNNLAMVPLAPKIKREKHDERTVFVVRCGVRDCPEKLGYFDGDKANFHHAFGYLWAENSKVWLKSKRGAMRDKSVRDTAKRMRARLKKPETATPEFEERANKLLDGVVIQKDNGTPVTADDKRKILLQVSKSDSRTGFPSTAVTEGLRAPICVKCARCGRISKIIGAGKTA